MFLKKTALVVLIFSAIGTARAETLPVLVPITGFLSLEGTAQRNGAVMAVDMLGKELGLETEVTDTGTSPEGAVTALRRALGGAPSAAVASMLGTQMLAMIPVADRAGMPLLTVSGTAKITELGSGNVFRFFPGDSVVKVAHAKYAVEELGAKRPALLYQTTAYGQSGAAHLKKTLAELGAPLVFEEGIDISVKDMLPALTRMQAAEPDILLLHLHSGSTALVIRQARETGNPLPVVAGSAMHQPTTAALLNPEQLKGVCAESASSPVSEQSGPVADFTAAYRKHFGTEPDAFALAQYDGTAMLIAAKKAGAQSADDVRAWLAGNSYDGLAMTYKSDGKGNMAHDAVVVCYDGASRVPAIAKRYENVDGIR
ncbi:ABC transporter substrate-binding protein [Nisaea acidiphila]|uniref:ABC transporter substrate-binding protein n=1 Tax=Nisaea acidiphila TaxID=1862145 RepID=A0A9J7ASW7_9PROT|nr:ABC transporter substrate-binding protein [Nisaea acidiphila]UUX50771.1 ABC transporter substrate-binding protein [Nisaea acidiphila]